MSQIMILIYLMKMKNNIMNDNQNKQTTRKRSVKKKKDISIDEFDFSASVIIQFYF